MDILTDKPRAHKAALSSKELHNVCNWGLNYMETLGNEFEDISLFIHINIVTILLLRFWGSLNLTNVELFQHFVYLWYEPAFAVLFYTGW